MPEPTPYPDLNELLADLVAGARAALAGNFCAAYLQGSFALGEADEHSDVDFLVVTNDEPSEREEAALQALHGRLYERDVAWAQHLEGSYAAKAALRRVDPARRPFLFLDNGARALVRDGHCNTAVVRWTLREHGVVLAGPPAAELVDPVPPDTLRAEARATLTAYVEWAHELDEGRAFNRWSQPYLVLTLCRILRTLAAGDVVSKRRAGEWAVGSLDPRWAPLVRRALADRPDPWRRYHEPADAGAAAETVAFADAALALVPLDQ